MKYQIINEENQDVFENTVYFNNLEEMYERLQNEGYNFSRIMKYTERRTNVRSLIGETIIIYLLAENEQSKQNYQNIKEYNELLKWFKSYDIQVIQYARAKRLGENFNKDINALDMEAEIKGRRIKELKSILKEA